MDTQKEPLLTRVLFQTRSFVKGVFFLSCTVALGIGLWQLRWGKVSMECLIGLCVGYFVRSWGITLGFHRFATHKSFKTHSWVEALLLMAGTAAIQGRVAKWVAVHMAHHSETDQPADPHSPYFIEGRATHSRFMGWYHAHVGWLFQPVGVPKLRQRMANLCCDDSVLAFVDKTTIIWVIVPFVVSYLVGGWPMVLWANFICLFFTYHGTWAVNSFGHMGERKSTRPHDHSQNKWWAALFIGEGFHGNHHEKPGGANLGWKPWEIALDTGTQVLWLLEKMRLVWNVHWVPSAR